MSYPSCCWHSYNLIRLYVVQPGSICGDNKTKKPLLQDSTIERTLVAPESGNNAMDSHFRCGAVALAAVSVCPCAVLAQDQETISRELRQPQRSIEEICSELPCRRPKTVKIKVEGGYYPGIYESKFPKAPYVMHGRVDLLSGETARGSPGET